MRTPHLALRDDPALSRFRRAVADAYGTRLDRIVLFGSRARGNARIDSDYDIAVFLFGPVKWLDEAMRLADIGTEILIDTGAVISAKPFRADQYGSDQPLIGQIRRDGVLL